MGTGNGNLLKHMKGNAHAEEYNAFIATLADQPEIDQIWTPLISAKARAAFDWLDWIVDANLAISVCEDPAFRRHSKIDDVCYKTVRKYMSKISEEISRKLKDQLPPRFGITFDGWTDGTSTHYVALFAVYVDADGNTQTPLLAFAPLIDETDLGADSYQELLVATLQWYDRDIGCILYFSGDNCSVNKALATRMGLVLIGCASHKLNLAVREWLAPHEPVLQQLQDLMVALSTIKYTKRLRDEDEELVAVKRIKTRWTGDGRMIARHERIKDTIYAADFQMHVGDLDHVLLTPAARTTVLNLAPKVAYLTNFMSQLQSQDCTLLHARIYFDAIIAHFAGDNNVPFIKYLSADATIVDSPHLESGVVKVLRHQQETLTVPERAALLPFRVVEQDAAQLVEGLGPVAAANALVGAARRGANPVSYPGVHAIPPTSNLVERFFSQAKLIQRPHRRALLPITFEEIAMLKMNKSLWTINNVVALQGVVEAEVAAEIAAQAAN